MRNLKIGAKVLLGFGVIIAIMLMFATFVIITTSITSSSVDEIHSDSQLQTKTKDMILEFYGARISGRVMTIRNDDAAYNDVISRLAQTQMCAEDIKKMIATNTSMERYTSFVDQALADIEAWRKKIEALQIANKTVDAIVEKAQVSKETFVGQSTGILNYQVELSRDEASQEITADSRMRRIDRFEFGAKLAQNVEYIGSSFEMILKSYDLTAVPESKAVLQETRAELQSFVDDSSLEYNIITGNALLTAMDEFAQDVDDFLTKYDERSRIVEEAIATGNKTLTSINALLDEIDTATEALVNKTVSTTALSLVIVVIISLAALIFALVFAIALAKIISRPIQRMQMVLDQAGQRGDLTFSDQTMQELHYEAAAKDEIGSSMASFITLMEHLDTVGKQLTMMSQGDLSLDVKPLSDKDTIGVAMKNVVDSLNRMFGNIQASTAQVSVGAKQIADGAQTLAQGSTQQAAAVEQLSSSIADIAQKTKDNAAMASDAASLAETIKGNAEKGSRQMDEMTQAVREINAASQNISKVIDTIDNIAFQTNILALNAAVEAARAGQHGKGFAVVAEEVRSLASKSADAARETGGMIQNSMEKAALGARIAGETAASLAEIVAGINQSTRLVADIARSSEEQSEGISQINRGIDQVAQVVQQNSATAEQSAASSEQMSGQSNMLEELISQFRLKDNGGISIGSGSHSAKPRKLEMPEKNTHVPAASGDFGKY